MKHTARFIVTFLAFVATYFFVYWLPLSLIPGLHKTVFVPNLIALSVAVVIAYLVWQKTAVSANSAITYIVLGGIIGGAIGFILGFFGPLLFYPQSNQGPLLGIFITGPAGFVVGLIAGAVYWRLKGRKQLNKA